MASYLVQVTLDPAAGFDDEAAVNTFAFRSNGALDAAGRLDILNAVSQFYSGTAPGAVRSVGSYLSSMLDRSVGGCSMKLYDITGHESGSPAGSPIEDSTFTLDAAVSPWNLPQQVASVLTLRARNALEQQPEGAGGIRPRQRYSGRLFLGPLNEGAADKPNGGHVRPLANFRTDVLAAAEALQDALVDGDYAWGVWSRTRATVTPIVRAEMDDSFDVLRSRKLAPTVRNARTFAPEPALVLGA